MNWLDVVLSPPFLVAIAGISVVAVLLLAVLL
jgi:hypothetical protein